MKAAYIRTDTNEPCAKIQIEFIITAKKIELAIQDILELEFFESNEEGRKHAATLTKGQVENNLRTLLKVGQYRFDELEEHGYTSLEETSKATAQRLFPDFYITK